MSGLHGILKKTELASIDSAPGLEKALTHPALHHAQVTALTVGAGCVDTETTPDEVSTWFDG